MDYKEVLNCLAPCGLSCEKCFAYNRGKVGRHARELKKALGNFDIFAERFSSFLPVFENYQGFKTLLAYLAEPDCPGCRQGKCKYPNCGVAPCHKSQGVDFCFQCEEFPCDRTNFDPHLHKRWIAMNQRMKEIGPLFFYEETREEPRYK